MLPLKDYQDRALEKLSDFLKLCIRYKRPDTAFSEVTKEIHGIELPYREITQLSGLPYVCLRIPTGGGKTLVASHSISIVNEEFLHIENSTVLWLVPSNAIRIQTLKALRDKDHPYRQALEATLGDVNVLDITEALSVKKASLNNETTIIVSTMQSFRIDDTEGRKVYQSSGELMEHFSSLPSELLDEIKELNGGTLSYSLANVLRIRRPIVIVDEAHNSRTDLSFETLARFNPSCILEYTATPDIQHNPSNVLYSVSAAELKAAKMIKIPLKLETNSDWQELLSDAIAKRNELEKHSSKEKEYIRPVMLIQAQPKQAGNSLTVEEIERTLISDHKISKEEIAVQAYDRHEIDNINIMDKDCKIKYIITINSLREGWDCPFAYVLCSFAELSTNVGVEQILGRIIRLPNAKEKENSFLNNSYAYALSSNFFQTANSLRDSLVLNGFNKQEAKELIIQMSSSDKQQELSFSDLEENFNEFDFIPELDIKESSFSTTISSVPQLDKLSNDIAEKVSFDEQSNTFTVTDDLTIEERDRVADVLTDNRDKEFIKQIFEVVQKMSPSQRGVKFEVPALVYKQGDLFEVFEESHFLNRKWDLNDFSKCLSEEEFPKERPRGQQGEIIISEDGKVQTNFIEVLTNQMSFYSMNEEWSVGELAYWLDKKIYTPDIPPWQSESFITKLILNLIEHRDFSINQLVIDKFRVKNAISRKIDEYRNKARLQNYQTLLFEENSVEVLPDITINFNPDNYPYNTEYSNTNHVFKKHYYPVIGDMKEQGEEFECAQFIDHLPEIKFWVRNLSRRPNHSFWLQTSTDKFYPDFVCLLNDGRYLVIEYKGFDRWSDDDSKEKRALGELWEQKSNGSCLFIMPRGKDLQAIKSKINS
ncbi:hypothetical protein ABD68_19260 [Bacillus endophyticus]|uniref:DEAD/DEAH box helicase n=1 Tax=Priestia endophytica TaxID=135735 RepID=UPI0018CCC504|nr:DEAD/DEAH box helicase family protein [Priestia endophytica]MBG9813635.1 hypothetical protein [Priestia endophytica]